MWIRIAAVNCALAVMCGAFGSHLLKKTLSASGIHLWHTATDYFFYHALGLLLVGIMLKSNLLASDLPAWFLQFGILFFCGSLYALAFGSTSVIGILTPIGGLSFILGWLLLAVKTGKTS